MGLFAARKKRQPEFPAVSMEEFEPVLRVSICTGEQTACLRSRETGRLRELMLVRERAELEAFCRAYGVAPEELKKVY